VEATQSRASQLECPTDGTCEQTTIATLAHAFGQPVLKALPSPAWDEYVRTFPIGFSRTQGVLALEPSGRWLPVVVSDSAGLQALDIVRRVHRRPVRPLFAIPEIVESAINQAYETHAGTARDMLADIDVGESIEVVTDRRDLLDTAGHAPVIRLVDQILFEAIKGHASDIHIQPGEDRVMARFRVDGVLFDAVEIPKPLQDEVVSRIKVLGNMNIAEKRLPQDGRATVRVADRAIDLRIASLPTSHSERVVIRLLDKSARHYTLPELGMPEQTYAKFGRMISLEHGLLLVTGPTGSGKSTTLYAALQQISTRERNVLTLEDPIEYELAGVSQTQINEKKGLTFATGLRNVLRQDPDVIMVGEIRDRETAMMAIQSSLTGHLVFSTLHTNDSASAVTRLLDLGIEPYLVASSLLSVLAQRLVRRICPQCRSAEQLDERLAAWMDSQSGFRPQSFSKGAGCANCRQTGYRGRIGLYELLIVDDDCRQQIQSRANASQVRAAALRAGMTLLSHDGLLKVDAGRTTLAEVVRVAQRSEDVLE